MTGHERPLKGGLGGRSTRMHERFKVETPKTEVLKRYLHYYSGKDLYLGLERNDLPSPENLFNDTKPFYVDFGCGRGEYAIMMAQQYPDSNFVGIDYHLRSLYMGIHHASALNLHNLKFIRADVRTFMPYLPSGSIEEASVLFPAPIVNPKHNENDVLNAPFIQQVNRTLDDDRNLLFVSDAEWYFKEKVRLMQDMHLFTLLLIQQTMETPITRYQKQWQEKGIPSNNAVLKRLR